MKKIYLFTAVLALLALARPAQLRAADDAANYAWPTAYQGVMLQGFFWDSYVDTNWANLEGHADEYAKYFSLIWIPQSGRAANNPSMGYDPVYWFTNYDSSFGTEAELRSMINAYKAKGVGMIADVVINHRSGVSNWTDFPEETWRGATYRLTAADICSNDEVAGQADQEKPTGAADTGDNFDGSRDLDHTSANVQANVKAYLDFLVNDLGYAGFRYDMVKGYGGQYVKMYNESAKASYSVGEYWDSYDPTVSWIEATGKQSTAFDFPFHEQLKKAFTGSAWALDNLAWTDQTTNTSQPAGLIHSSYRPYAVTFVDNHDTYRDDNRFADAAHVAAVNAFMLCSPGVPCVFLPHYLEHKMEIQNLIAIRNAVGVTNTSTVTVIRAQQDCYMAKVAGTDGKELVVKVGYYDGNPDGYTAADVKASGTDYCVWTKTDVPSLVVNHNNDKDFTVYFDNSSSYWPTPHIYHWDVDAGTNNGWPGKAMTRVEGNVWAYTVPAGTDYVIFNAGDGDGSKTADLPVYVNADGTCHIYSKTGDQGDYAYTPATDMPEALYLYGDVDGASWTPATDGALASAATAVAGVYEWKKVALTSSTQEGAAGYSFFNFATAVGDGFATATIYGATEEQANKTIGSGWQIDLATVDPAPFRTLSGTYDITVNLNDQTLTLLLSDATYSDDYPSNLFLTGNLSNGSWVVSYPEAPMAGNSNGVYLWSNAEIVDADAADGEECGYFSFIAWTSGKAATDNARWDDVNGGPRYGANANGVLLHDGVESATVERYVLTDGTWSSTPTGLSNDPYAWKVAPGTYEILLNLSKNSIKLTKQLTTGIDAPAAADTAAPACYYNLQGMRVSADALTPGIYVVRQGARTSKVLVR